MANTTQDEIYQNFLEVSKQQAGELAEAAQSLAGVILQADEVRREAAQQTAKTAASSGGTGTSSASKSTSTSSGDSGGGSVLSTVFDVFKSGLSVSPLIKGILGLFGGGDPPAPAPLVKYALPPAIQFQAAEVGGRMLSADYDQSGAPRGYGVPASGRNGDSAAGGTVAAAPQITVNVQAMDARSFMDRSNEIAAAVREAMLNSNSINDVVNDL